MFQPLFKLNRLILTGLLLLGVLANPLVYQKQPLQVKAENTGSTFSDLQQQLNDNLKRQSDLQKKIKDSQNQEKSLASQIAYMEEQIELTGLQIDETQTRIEQLTLDVATTSDKLDETQVNLDNKTDLANKRIRSIYENGSVNSFERLLQADSISDYFLLQKYSSAIRDQDVRLINSLKELKETYDAQKTDLSNQKKSAEDLKIQLQNQQASLDSQKNQKNNLLATTKNSEANYQALLTQVKLDQQAIQSALLNLGTKLGPVKRGDIIAFQGNTGCVIPSPTSGNPTAGSHLHFGYLINSRVVNPLSYLNSGALGWPETNPRITQYFGANANNGLYGPGGHPAIDMTVSFGSPIYAAKSGTAYLANDNGCGNNPLHPKGWGITIDHGDGTKTIYWHIQH